MTVRDCTYIHGYDDDAGERYTEVEIIFDFDPGYYEELPGGYSYQKYWVPGEIYVKSVRVEFVEYYNPHGDIILKLKREDIAPDRLKELDADAYEYVVNEVENRNVLADDLVENAG